MIKIACLLYLHSFITWPFPFTSLNYYKWEALISFLGKKNVRGKKKDRARARPFVKLSPSMLSNPPIELTQHTGPKAYMCLERYASLSCGFKRFKEGTAERNLFLEQNQIGFIFSAYTDACSSSWKIVVASKRPLILFIYIVCINTSVCIVCLDLRGTLQYMLPTVYMMYMYFITLDYTSGITVLANFFALFAILQLRMLCCGNSHVLGKKHKQVQLSQFQ